MQSLFKTIFFIFLISQGVFGQKFERYKNSFDTLFYSESLGYSKKISVTLPLEYQDNLNTKKYPLMIVFDSQNIRSHQYILKTIDYLTSNEQIPSSVIISIQSSLENRYKETQLEISDDNVLGSKNELFILKELIPYIQKRYKTIPFNILIGHSRYGYFTSYLLSKYPHDTHAVIAASPFLSQKKVCLVDSICNIKKTYSSNKTLYYRFGIGNDYPEDFMKLDSALKKTPNNLKVSFKGFFFKEAIHNTTPGLLIGTALYEIFEYWNKQQNAYLNSTDTTISSFYEKIEEHYGENICFSLGALNGKGWGFFNQKEYEKAINAWKQLVYEYPNFAEGYLYIIMAQKELNINNNEMLKKFINSLKISEFYTKKEKKDLKKEVKAL